jgi:hypothetical protein
VDQISIERLNELKQNQESAAAKVSSIEKTLKTTKAEELDLSQEEHSFSNLRGRYELEYSLNKELLLKARDFEGLKKLTDSSVRIIGTTSLVPVKFKVSRPLKIVLGFLFGVVLSLLGIYYYFEYLYFQLQTFIYL